MKRNTSEIERVFRRKNTKLENLLKIFDNDNSSLDNVIEGILDISTTLRILLDSNKKKKSLSVICKLGFEDIPFFPGIQGGIGVNMVGETKLVHTRISNIGSSFYSPDDIKSSFYTTFNEWWTDKVIDLKNGVVVSRERVIKTISDKEGGAHLDDKYDEFYSIICGTQTSSPETLNQLRNNLYYISIMSIAKEYIQFVKNMDMYTNNYISSRNDKKTFFVVSRCIIDKKRITNLRLFNISDDIATSLYLGVEGYKCCDYYISKPIWKRYLNREKQKQIEFRVYDKHKDEELMLIVDNSKRMNAFAVIREKKCILLNGSMIYKSEREQYKRFEQKNMLVFGESWIKTKTDIEFSTKTQALRFVLAESRYNIKWGLLNTE